VRELDQCGLEKANYNIKQRTFFRETLHVHSYPCGNLFGECGTGRTQTDIVIGEMENGKIGDNGSPLYHRPLKGQSGLVLTSEDFRDE